MSKIAKGSFEVKPAMLPADEATQRLGAMRMTFEKRFQGPLDATGFVSMIGMMDNETGSGAYVALEKITGSLDGRKGGFYLQHSCAMDRGKPSQAISIVPNSGTEQLAGISGKLTVDIVNDDHFYTLEYELKA